MVKPEPFLVVSGRRFTTFPLRSVGEGIGSCNTGPRMGLGWLWCCCKADGAGGRAGPPRVSVYVLAVKTTGRRWGEVLLAGPSSSFPEPTWMMWLPWPILWKVDKESGENDCFIWRNQQNYEVRRWKNSPPTGKWSKIRLQATFFLQTTLTLISSILFDFK